MKTNIFKVSVAVIALAILVVIALLPIYSNSAIKPLGITASADGSNTDGDKAVTPYFGGESTIVVPFDGAEIEIRVVAENWIWPACDKVIVETKTTKGVDIFTKVYGNMYWKNGKYQYFEAKIIDTGDKTFDALLYEQWSCDHIVYFIEVTYNGKTKTYNELKATF